MYRVKRFSVCDIRNVYCTQSDRKKNKIGEESISITKQKLIAKYFRILTKYGQWLIMSNVLIDN